VTYGQLKLRMVQMFPGLSLDLIEGWINDRHAEILGELPWSHQDVQGMLITTAPYTTGTVAVTNGSAAVTLTTGTWTTAMTGRAFRVTGRSEFYEFTRVTDTTGTLDRVYEGTTSSAAGYSIFQHIYPLPADCRLLNEDAFSDALGGLKRFTHAQLNESDPSRKATGTPQGWASYMDDNSVPPRMQVELWPIPDTATGIPFTYSADADDLTATSTIIKVWMQPSALVEGVTALIKRHLKDYAGAQLAAVAAGAALKNMRTSEAQGMAPAQMRLDSYYTRHRHKRFCR
jgi:hypothetical protein